MSYAFYSGLSSLRWMLDTFSESLLSILHAESCNMIALFGPCRIICLINAYSSTARWREYRSLFSNSIWSRIAHKSDTYRCSGNLTVSGYLSNIFIPHLPNFVVGFDYAVAERKKIGFPVIFFWGPGPTEIFVRKIGSDFWIQRTKTHQNVR